MSNLEKDLIFMISAGISGAISTNFRNNWFYSKSKVRKNGLSKLLGCGGAAALTAYVLRNYVQHPNNKVTKRNDKIIDGILLGMLSGLLTNELISTTEAQEVVAEHHLN